MEPNDKLDQWLDQALDQYSKVELRAGLEMRVMASVAAERERRAKQRIWAWSFAAASVCAAIVIVLCLGGAARREYSQSAEQRSQSVKAVTREPEPSTSSRARHQEAEVQIAKHAPRRTRRSRVELVSKALPKADQFPSPRPLSEQEKLLLSYFYASPRADVVSPVAAAKDLDDLRISRLRVTNLDTPLLQPNAGSGSNASN